MKMLAFLLLVTSWIAPSKGVELQLDLGHGVTRWSSEMLLARNDARTIQVPTDVAFKRPMRYRAIRLLALLAGIKLGDQLQFIADDGFATNIPAALILNRQGSTAWLAVENPARPWPLLPGEHGHAGPFYVVWTRPYAADVGPEQWPYALASIRKLDAIAARFPANVPASPLPADSTAKRGFAVFERTCFACHTLNGQGDARLGQDLNIPHNPAEYRRADLLRAYIRDAQSLRRWPQARMPGFDAQALSGTDLDALLAYLRYMAAHRTTHIGHP